MSDTKLSIQFDQSGSQIENAFEIIGFALNKEKKCKNSDYVLGSTDNDISSSFFKHMVYHKLGFTVKVQDCSSIKIIHSNIPIYIKQIDFYIINISNSGLSSFKNTEIFNVCLNDKLLFNQEILVNSMKTQDSSGFYIGSLVRKGDDFEYFQDLKAFDDNISIIDIAKHFDIDMSISYND